MTDEIDWRLETGESEWMFDAVLRPAGFTSPSADWDHEHCALCWQKFTEEPHEDTIAEGFVYRSDGSARSENPTPLEERTFPGKGVVVVGAPYEERWICPKCFEDFRDHFRWTALDPENPNR